MQETGSTSSEPGATKTLEFTTRFCLAPTSSSPSRIKTRRAPSFTTRSSGALPTSFSSTTRNVLVHRASSRSETSPSSWAPPATGICATSRGRRGRLSPCHAMLVPKPRPRCTPLSIPSTHHLLPKPPRTSRPSMSRASPPNTARRYAWPRVFGGRFANRACNIHGGTLRLDAQRDGAMVVAQEVCVAHLALEVRRLGTHGEDALPLLRHAGV